MSVTAHYTECFVLNRHFSAFFNFRWLVVGSAFPDAFVFDRLFMYTLDMKMHRDYFFGWFHSLPVPLAVAALVYYRFGRRRKSAARRAKSQGSESAVGKRDGPALAGFAPRFGLPRPQRLV